MGQHPSRPNRNAFVLGGLLTVAIGLAFALLPLGNGLADLSYDLPFLFRSNVRVTNVVIVYLDEQSRLTLQQPRGVWDRSLHVELLRRLTTAGARLVFYDILFLKPNPAVDAAFGEAIRRHGTVVLGATMESTAHQAGATAVKRVETLQLPSEDLRQAAHAVGLLQVPIDENRVVRKLYSGSAEHESAVWVAARLGQSPTTAEKRQQERWLNYYGPGRFFDSVSLGQVLAGDGVPTDFFRGKAVFVGGDPLIFGAREHFATPYTRFGGGLTPGVEVLATSYVNLVRDEWLQRLGLRAQAVFVTVFGLIAGCGLLLLRPVLAAVATAVAVFALIAASFVLQWHSGIIWSWLVPVAVQSPIALAWAVGAQYSSEARKRKNLRRAFAAYLSPHLADRIANSDFDLSLGGKVVEASVMFTDLDGFTSMSETLDPREVSEILVAYFNQTTRAILDEEGTIIKYMGDAVMAVWGAPVPEPEHAKHAVLAACKMVAAGRQTIHGRSLRTRLGINSGPVLAGNLGSEFRFDYTAIGTTTNLASRLEALNKPLGTDILIGEATRASLGDTFRTRCLGQFMLRGNSQPFVVHEVLGLAVDTCAHTDWLATFDHALRAFANDDFEEAARTFSQIRGLRQQPDGPSQFYLQLLADLRAGKRPPLQKPGVVSLDAK